MRRLTAFVVLVVMIGSFAAAKEPVDLEMVEKIREEGLERSQVMEILWYLTDYSGPRLTGSPGLKRAMEWCRNEMRDWGLENVEIEPWGQFGHGWELERFSIHMNEPYYSPIIAYPKAWTRSTGGVLKGKPILLEYEQVEDLEKYKGKLAGAIVMMPMNRKIDIGFEPDARRFEDSRLQEMSEPIDPSQNPDDSRRIARFRKRMELRQHLRKLLNGEGVAAILEGGSRGKHGTLFVSSGGSFRMEGEPGVPAAVVAAEHYARMVRLIQRDIPVEVELEIRSRIPHDDKQGYNVLAELPGSDPELKAQVVMLGAHLDSWHAATGATDNAAGSAVMMEAVRILKKLDVRPRRTIRVALWTGEEQGLLGARAYVKSRFGDRLSMELKPEHENLSAYYNLDNGTGKLRGIYLQGNDALKEVFEAYLKPFHDLGATTVALRNTGGTDHLAFDAMGLPAFQFIQDRIAYSTRTHHTNMDFYDHVVEDDLKQAATVIASFVYHTAQRDERLPRKALPKPRGKPAATP